MRDDWKEHLLEQIAAGRSVRAICREDEGMPERTFVNRALLDSERTEGDNENGFARRYARANVAREEVLFDDLFAIADDDTEDVQRSKLRVDTRKWALSKLNPKRYGDKLQYGGAEDLPPVKVDMTPTEAARQIAFALRNGLENKDA
jgi:hypothetical protein